MLSWQLLQKLITHAEEAREHCLDNVAEAKAFGDRDAAAIHAESAREVCSTLRQARRALKEMEEDKEKIQPKIDAASDGQCPFCKADSVNYSNIEMTGGGQCEQNADCRDCGAEWWEVYCMTNVVRVNCDCRQHQAKGECDHA
jgi:hypothetical protein